MAQLYSAPQTRASLSPRFRDPDSASATIFARSASQRAAQPGTACERPSDQLCVLRLGGIPHEGTWPNELIASATNTEALSRADQGQDNIYLAHRKGAMQAGIELDEGQEALSRLWARPRRSGGSISGAAARGPNHASKSHYARTNTWPNRAPPSWLPLPLFRRPRCPSCVMPARWRSPAVRNVHAILRVLKLIQRGKMRPLRPLFGRESGAGDHRAS